jgi:phospholipase C
VHGPNGFYRQFAGEGPSIAVEASGHELKLAITNGSAAAVRLTLASAYDGRHARVTVPSRSTVTVAVHTASRGGWYDVSVTADASPQYLRRLAGHAETGEPGISDPALGRS